jgi:hypothetical protein
MKAIVAALGVNDSDGLFNITEKQIRDIRYEYSNQRWSEICRVLEVLGYDISGRRFDYRCNRTASRPSIKRSTTEFMSSKISAFLVKS